MSYNELDLWKVRGTCPNHGDYIYNARKNEESVGCPVCTVNELKSSKESGDFEIKEIIEKRMDLA